MLFWSSHSLLTSACTQRLHSHIFFFCFLDCFYKVNGTCHWRKRTLWNEFGRIFRKKQSQLFGNHLVLWFFLMVNALWNVEKFLYFSTRNCSTPLTEDSGKKSLDCNLVQLRSLMMISTICPHHVKMSVPSISERAQIIFQRCDSVSKFCTHSFWGDCK